MTRSSSASPRLTLTTEEQVLRGLRECTRPGKGYAEAGTKSMPSLEPRLTFGDENRTGFNAFLP